MSNKTKPSLLADSKRSTSLNTNGGSKSLPKSGSGGKKMASMLYSLPFKYAFASDGCTSTDATTNGAGTETSRPNGGVKNESNSAAKKKFLFSSLSARSYANGSSFDASDSSTSESLFIKKESISSLDMDDGRALILKSSSSSPKTDANGQKMFFINDEDCIAAIEAVHQRDAAANNLTVNEAVSHNLHDLFQSEGSFFAGNTLVAGPANTSTATTTTLPNQRINDQDDSSYLKKYAIRRHHSAPQSDAKWLQVNRL